MVLTKSKHLQGVGHFGHSNSGHDKMVCSCFAASICASMSVTQLDGELLLRLCIWLQALVSAGFVNLRRQSPGYALNNRPMITK